MGLDIPSLPTVQLAPPMNPLDFLPHPKNDKLDVFIPPFSHFNNLKLKPPNPLARLERLVTDVPPQEIARLLADGAYRMITGMQNGTVSSLQDHATLFFDGAYHSLENKRPSVEFGFIWKGPSFAPAYYRFIEVSGGNIISNQFPGSPKVFQLSLLVAY